MWQNCFSGVGGGKVVLSIAVMLVVCALGILPIVVVTVCVAFMFDDDTYCDCSFLVAAIVKLSLFRASWCHPLLWQNAEGRAILHNVRLFLRSNALRQGLRHRFVHEVQERIHLQAGATARLPPIEVPEVLWLNTPIDIFQQPVHLRSPPLQPTHTQHTPRYKPHKGVPRPLNPMTPPLWNWPG